MQAVFCMTMQLDHYFFRIHCLKMYILMNIPFYYSFLPIKSEPLLGPRSVLKQSILPWPRYLARKTATLLPRTVTCQPETGVRVCSACHVSTAFTQYMEAGSSGRVTVRSSHQALEAT